jgi:hypothetical protein
VAEVHGGRPEQRGDVPARAALRNAVVQADVDAAFTRVVPAPEDHWAIGISGGHGSLPDMAASLRPWAERVTGSVVPNAGRFIAARTGRTTGAGVTPWPPCPLVAPVQGPNGGSGRG